MKAPILRLDHLKEMTNQIGLVEHARGREPNLEEGYSVDDNARAVQVCLRLGKFYPELKKLEPLYFHFLQRARRGDGFALDLEEDGHWKEDNLWGEHFGRTMAALAESGQEIKEYFDIFRKIEALRTVAQLLGALYFYRKAPLELVDLLALRLVESYEKNRTIGWQWFEEILTYDNSRLSMGLFYAYELTGNKKYLKIAEESFAFYTTLSWDGGEKNYFSFPGSRGWYSKSGKKIVFDQQPIEAGSVTEGCVLAYKVTKDEHYARMAKAAFEWYGGNNIARQNMIDPSSGGVYDGIEEDKINKNEGAEAMLSYLLAWEALVSVGLLE